MGRLLKTTRAGVRWPPVPGPDASAILGMLHYFEQTQWWPAEDLLQAQFQQLRRVLGHAYQNVPFYRARLQEAGFTPRGPLDKATWQRIPVLTRRNIQQEKLQSPSCPPGHGRLYKQQSSGSTGEPVTITTTDHTRFFWTVFTMRDHHWHQRDFSGRLASIRAPTDSQAPKEQGSWGPPVAAIYKTGRAGSLSLSVDVSRQAQWLLQFDPDYLLTYPSNLLAILDYCREHGLRPGSLREVRTMSETVGQHLRETLAGQWGVPLVDMYTAQEVGYVALQCPQAPVYHAQSENLLVEILNENGDPCAPGEIGRIVVSSLHNFSTPLIRYELRDHAEAGAPCACGRGLPTIKRILGRERNMMTMPDGEKRWPLTGYRQYEEIVPEVQQFQFIQRSLQQVEVRLVVASALTPEKSAALTAHIQKALGHPFDIKLTFMDTIPKSPSGKFEEFISEVT